LRGVDEVLSPLLDLEGIGEVALLHVLLVLLLEFLHLLFDLLHCLLVVLGILVVALGLLIEETHPKVGLVHLALELLDLCLVLSKLSLHSQLLLQVGLSSLLLGQHVNEGEADGHARVVAVKSGTIAKSSPVSVATPEAEPRAEADSGASVLVDIGLAGSLGSRLGT